jgi:hypothetical protein
MRATGNLAHDSEAAIRARLEARNAARRHGREPGPVK